MFILKFAEKNKEVREVESRLEEMSLAFKLEKDDALDTVVLEEDNTKYSGLKAINEYLEKLNGELKSWYYCDC